ncbi:hypothetical protein L1049_020313 [Liquidambar formosana]|uniref:Uncharacterized protein n=1 Tax=Liquidambar formosana TaxID=63359 RepID=A0AAP0S8A8_LIQFO
MYFSAFCCSGCQIKIFISCLSYNKQSNLAKITHSYSPTPMTSPSNNSFFSYPTFLSSSYKVRKSKRRNKVKKTCIKDDGRDILVVPIIYVAINRLRTGLCIKEIPSLTGYGI